MIRVRSSARLAASLSAALVVAACGIPLDDAPRAIEVTTTTEHSGTAPESTAASGDGTVVLYYLSDNLLTAVEAEGSNRSPAQVLTSLFAGVPAAARSEVSTQIPNGTQLLGTVITGGSLVIDVSSEFNNLVGSGRTLALAQIVMTVTELDEVRSVSMRIDGVDVPVYSPETGDTASVTDCDYRSLFPDNIGGIALDRLTESVPTSEPPAQDDTTTAVETVELTTDEQHLLDRIVALEERCEPS